MKDIVERIRYHISIRGGPAKDDNGKYIGTTWLMMLEAADEIERLRKMSYDLSNPGSTIVIPESELHKLILTAGEVAYDRALKGQSWELTRQELIDALVTVTRPLEDNEAKVLLGG